MTREKLIEFIKRRHWFGWWWCSVCSKHMTKHYDHACDNCRRGCWYSRFWLGRFGR